MRSEQDRHNLGHAKYLCDRATPEAPEVCFDYTLVQSILTLVESDAKVIADLRAAFLVVLKAENKCWSFENGKPCDTAHCGCLLEMQCYIDDAAFKRRVDEQTAGKSK